MVRTPPHGDVRFPLAAARRGWHAGEVPPATTTTASDPRFAERYRAMSSRDSRFDGQFITGVHSTGIYCRPSCPAITPQQKNVSFFRTAAAAHEAGLRACKRCLPDAVPGSPDWNSHDDLASRAMRLITDGLVEREGVTGLAAHLGYTSRHLTRVLVAELGAGPLALSRAHRAQTARTLLVSTDLSIADTAFAAGFSSIRQFNDTISAVYESTPTQLRQRARTRSGAPAGAREPADGGVTISLRLPARPPFDGAGLLSFLADHAVAGLETSTADSFERRVRLPHGLATLRLSLVGLDTVLCEARLEQLADVATLVARVRRLLDLDADSVAIDGALGADPALAPLVAACPGLRLPGSLDAQETLFRTLVGQQISVAAARTVHGRYVARLGTDGLFPTAAQILADGDTEGGPAVVRGPASRVTTILATARAVVDGRLSLDVATPVEEFTASLVALPGIGPWTAGYLAMRVLGNPDTLLASDLVVQQSAAALGLPAKPRALAQRGEHWAPWRSYATMHLWRARPAPAGRVTISG
jgi:AraC family transcriptional regulator of adaptative response / DNA-3-methyladenine glycosylase II